MSTRLEQVKGERKRLLRSLVPELDPDGRGGWARQKRGERAREALLGGMKEPGKNHDRA